MAIKVAGAKKRKKKGLLRRVASKVAKRLRRGRRGKAGKKAGTSGGG
jgi:hypothetical protein